MRRYLALPLALALSAAAAGAVALAAGPGSPASSAPEQGRFVVLEPVSGDVQVRPASSTRYRDLTGRRRYPVGVTVDAQEGAVRVIVAGEEEGSVSKAVFSEGKFTVTQRRGDDPLVTLTLTGPSYADVCDGASAARKRRKRVRRLWGDGSGSFRTSGRYSAATVRGTRWLTEDRCDGTVTRVVRGEVEVDDFQRDAPEPSPTPTPGPQPPVGGEPPPAPPPAPAGGGEGEEDPSVRPAPRDAEGDVIVSPGGTYVARP